MQLIRKSTGLLLVLGLVSLIACTRGSDKQNDAAAGIKNELDVIDSLLRNPEFTENTARALDAAYYAGIGQQAPPFLNAADSTTIVRVKQREEKIATSIAGFYALECGVELLSKDTTESFTTWLDKINSGQVNPEAMLLLNRFANATWKAGQPFRDMARLQRYNFIIASKLSKEEVDKDSIQIVNASKKLSLLMSPVRNQSMANQMNLLRTLLQDSATAVSMSSYSDSAFAASQNQPAQNSNGILVDTSTLPKTVKQIKIATSIAGFYALECALNYLVTIKKELPSVILTKLVSDSLSAGDQTVFARFANATWKAGQPFRGLNRITRPTFTPFYFLSPADIEKDMVQVKAAARIVLAELAKNKN